MKKYRVLTGLVSVVLVVALGVVGFRLYYLVKDGRGRDETRRIREDVEDDYPDIVDPEVEDGSESKTLGTEDDNSSAPLYSDFSDEGKELANDLIARLREKYNNDDVIGYVVLNGYDVEYPIMYGETNDDYIKTSPYGGYDYNGSIFLDSGNRPDFSDSRSVVYGHNMANRSMFGCLRDYYLEDLDGKTFTIYSENGIGLYNILSSETVNAFEENYCLFPGQTYKLEYQERGYTEDQINEILSVDTQMEEFYTKVKNNCFVWNDEVEHDNDSKIVTLMTCYADGKTYRLGVSGVLAPEAPEVTEDETQ